MCWHGSPCLLRRNCEHQAVGEKIPCKNICAVVRHVTIESRLQAKHVFFHAWYLSQQAFEVHDVSLQQFDSSEEILYFARPHKRVELHLVCRVFVRVKSQGGNKLRIVWIYGRVDVALSKVVMLIEEFLHLKEYATRLRQKTREASRYGKNFTNLLLY